MPKILLNEPIFNIEEISKEEFVSYIQNLSHILGKGKELVLHTCKSPSIIEDTKPMILSRVCVSDVFEEVHLLGDILSSISLTDDKGNRFDNEYYEGIWDFLNLLYGVYGGYKKHLSINPMPPNSAPPISVQPSQMPPNSAPPISVQPSQMPSSPSKK